MRVLKGLCRGFKGRFEGLMIKYMVSNKKQG